MSTTNDFEQAATEIKAVKPLAADAIERSQSHNEIVHVEWPRPVVMVEALRQAAYAVDGVDFDDVDAGDVWECWAFREDADEGDMLWRVHVRAAD